MTIYNFESFYIEKKIKEFMEYYIRGNVIDAGKVIINSAPNYRFKLKQKLKELLKDE